MAQFRIPKASESQCRYEISGSSLSHARRSTQLGAARLFAFFVFLFLSCTVATRQAWTQATTGSIAGTITDGTQASLPQTQVTATNAGTGVANVTVADATGHYQFLSLPAGTYTVLATHAGFASTTLSGITLNVYQQLTVNIVLKVGEEKQTVMVEATPTLVDTTNASLGTVVGEKAIQDMPLNLREVGALALLVPGTVDTSGRSMSTAFANGSGFNDVGYSGAGGGSGGNLLLIDGMISRALNNSGFALNPPPEMVHEFKIQNNVYDASFGLASGTVMNLVTNSGTNAIHGSAWEYVRNSQLDASGYFAVSRPDLTRNQFGAAIGGPIVKDKIFYFGSYEGMRLTQGVVSSSIVPTDAEKSGDFSSFLTGSTIDLCAASGSASSGLIFDSGQLFDPKSEYLYQCPANPDGSQSSVLVGTPISGNKITTLDPVAQKALALYPSSNTSAGVVNYVNQTPQEQQNDQYDGRVDAALTKSDSVFVRYMLGNANTQIPGALPGFGAYQHFRGQNLVGGWTRTLTPSSVNDVRIGYQKNYLVYGCQGCPRPSGTLAGFGIAGLTNPVPQYDLYPSFGFTNFAAWGDGSWTPVTVPDEVEHFADTFTKVAGRHTLAFGGVADFWQTKNVTDPPQVNGAFSYDGQYSSLANEIPGVSGISDLADFELGYPAGAQYTKNAIITNLVGGLWASLYAQDNIRLTSHVTMQAGLRWEFRRQPYDTKNQIAALYPLSYSYTPGDALMVTALPDAANDALCSEAYFISASGQCLIMTSDMRRQKGLTGNKISQLSFGPGPGVFAPRVGFSWQPYDSDKLVVHAGFGIFMDLPNTNRMGSFANDNPVFTQTVNYVTSFGAPPPLTNGVPTVTQQAFANADTAPLSSVTGYLMPSPFYKTPQTYSWSFSVQTQLARDLGAEIGYVGNHGVHLDYLHDAGNQAKPGTGDVQSRRVFPDLNALVYDDFQNSSSYNSLYAKLEKRLSNGLSGMVSYTFAKTLNIQGGDQDIQSLPQDDNNPESDYGLADFSVGQTVVVSPIYELPFGKGRRFLNTGGPASALVGGWEASAIISAHSGLPFTVGTAQDYSNSSSNSPRPDRVCSGRGAKSVSEWFDTSCFSTDALAQALANGAPRFGDSGRNILTAPGYQNWDIALMKRTDIGERFHVQIKGEFFNAFNHTNFGTPGRSIGSSLAGIITSAGSPRDVQLAVKLEF